MNPLLKYCAAVAVVMGALYGAYHHGCTTTANAMKAENAEISIKAAQAVTDALEEQRKAEAVAAEAISKVKTNNTAVRAEVQHEIQTKIVYRDCVLPADGLRLANEALAGKRAKSTGGGKLPAANANAGQ